VTFFSLLDELLHDTLQVSLPAFRPELALASTIVLMLLARIPRLGNRINAALIAIPGLLFALWYAAPWLYLAGGDPPADAPALGVEIFTGLLRYDALAVYFRSVLLVFALLFVVFTQLSGIPDREDGPDFYTLVLGGTLGMCLMTTANHLLMVFLAVEMASVPSYVLAGMLKGRRKSSEAALKYAVYGAGAAGVMLYGISLLAGALGSVHLPTLASQLASLSAEQFAERQGVLMLGGLMVMVGLAFKLSAFPFHFWCPDVFEGASAEVNAFLSVASKAAALALLIRVSLGFAHIPSPPPEAAPPVVAAQATVSTEAPQRIPTRPVSATLSITVADEASPLKAAAPVASDAPLAPLDASRRFAAGLIGLLAALSCTFGNLAAYGQTNIKRLFAYSTIAHAGYIMMPIAAAVSLAGSDLPAAQRAIAAVAVYVGVYLFMNLGAFAIIAFLRNAMRSEEIADYAGLIRRAPGVVICFSLILVSLIGLPPFAGFIGKLLAFYALIPAGQYWLLVIGGLNTVLSLFYYLRVVKVMALDPEPEDRLPVQFSLVSPQGVFVVLVTLPIVGLFVWWDPLNRWALAAASGLLT
jgi:NADH-quinone oxidoreductase subunit N